MYRMRCTSVREYDVTLSRGVLELDNEALAARLSGHRSLFLVDAAVEANWGSQLRNYISKWSLTSTIEVLNCTEPDKTPETVLQVCGAALRSGLGRRDVIVGIGGGICCDVVSVSASLVRRGIPYVCVPTTLVAQIDAGVGLKGAVNFEGTKNYLGSFAPPDSVLIDPTFLRSVSPSEIRAGLSEMLKMAILVDADLFSSIRASGPSLIESGFSYPRVVGEGLIRRACQLMLDQLSVDCYETSFKRLVDFGHTFSGRIEEESNFTLRHGEAVAIDMALTSAIGVELGCLRTEDFETILATMTELGLPIRSPLCTTQNLSEAMHAAVAHRDGSLNLVTPTSIGAAMFIDGVDEVNPSTLEAALGRVDRWIETCEELEDSAAMDGLAG